MGGPVAGNVVVLPFPCADLAQPKLRPALVLAVTSGGDCVLAMISTKSHFPEHEVTLTQHSFDMGGLSRESVVRCDRLFTAARVVIQKIVGRLDEKTLGEAVRKTVQLFPGTFSAARKMT